MTASAPAVQWLALGLAALAVLGALALLWLARRPRGGVSPQQIEQIVARAVQLHADRLAQELLPGLDRSARAARQELAHSLEVVRAALLRQHGESARTQGARLEAFSSQLAQLRVEWLEALQRQMRALGEINDSRMAEIRRTLHEQLHELRSGNDEKLEAMRRTVDEKLQATLERRLGESFREVASRLEQVHRGLGEMRVLAQGVGDLKHLLSNVKTRGMFGEAQLAQLLEQVFSPEQYAAQVVTRPGSRNVVDFAVRLPGGGDEPMWLPIDAKFPVEDYERLVRAQERADAPAAEAAGAALERRVRDQARSIHEKYVEPPHTTDFAVLFLPSEGLYAEVLRRPGLVDTLQRQWRVTVAGPTTLLAMLGSLQMGFRALALQRRSSEVWQVLAAVKTEFGRFGDVLARVRRQTQTVLNTLDESERRTRAMDRKLRDIEAMPLPAGEAPRSGADQDPAAGGR